MFINHNDNQFWLSKIVDTNEIENENHYGMPIFSSKFEQKNVFKFAKAQTNEIRMTKFLLSCMKTIKFVEDFLMNQGNTLQQTNLDFRRSITRMRRLEKSLQDLELFCNNKLLSYLDLDQ